MQITCEVYLEAWGLRLRREHARLHRPDVAQNRYQLVSGGGSVGADVDPHEYEIVYLDDGRPFRVSTEQIERVARIVACLGTEYSIPLKARYVFIGSKEDRAKSMGVSTATFSRYLRDAKHAFGAWWYSGADRRVVVQRGVLMKVVDS